MRKDLGVLLLTLLLLNLLLVSDSSPLMSLLSLYINLTVL